MQITKRGEYDEVRRRPMSHTYIPRNLYICPQYVQVTRKDDQYRLKLYLTFFHIQDTLCC